MGNGSDGGVEMVILASCMHAGTRIVSLRHSGGEDSEWEFEVLARFEEHKSMNYGSDVQPITTSPAGQATGKRKIVSTSFYDKLLAVWNVEI
jgi:diphthamide biosynthesis protein 7